MRSLTWKRCGVRALAVLLFSVACSICVSRPCRAQGFSQRGFVDGRLTLFPQDVANDTQNQVADLLVREESFLSVADWLQLAGGVDARVNSHDQVSSSWRPDFSDRGILRPALSIRRLSATLTRGPITLDLGKQFIRWGTTDIVTPTDRFAPRDYLDVVNSEFLPVTGARLTLQAAEDTFEVVWVPLFTPSRLPLLDQRWTPVPAAGALFTISAAPTVFPSRAQAGVRWAHAGSGYEYALMVFDGFNHLPNFVVRPGQGPLELEVVRRYPSLRTYGGDAALPTKWLTAKGEAAYFTSSTVDADEYVLYVIQLERQTGEWLITGGYAGEIVTRRRTVASFAPDRGLTRSLIARASYTLSPSRSLTVEGAVRQNGEGVYAKGEYSWVRGQHWRTTVMGVVLAGKASDFIGQYQRNSHAGISLRYSF